MADAADEGAAGVRVVVLHLPEDEGEGLGFTLTRTVWDPYPWVREVTRAGRAEAAGLRAGDCLLQADGGDLLGLPVGQVAGVIRGDGGGRKVSLLVWSCGVSPQDDPELLWSAGGGARGERSRRALGGVLKALACSVCSATAGSRARSAQCTRGHLYCAGCRSRLQRCALCREPLPALESPLARNLVAEQVFEAIAAVYELKDLHTTPIASTSATTSPHRSPTSTPKMSLSQKNSPSCLRKTVQFGLTNQPHHGSDVALNKPKPDVSELRRILSSPVAKDTGSQTDLNKASNVKNPIETGPKTGANTTVTDRANNNPILTKLLTTVNNKNSVETSGRFSLGFARQSSQNSSQNGSHERLSNTEGHCPHFNTSDCCQRPIIPCVNMCDCHTGCGCSQNLHNCQSHVEYAHVHTPKPAHCCPENKGHFCQCQNGLIPSCQSEHSSSHGLNLIPVSPACGLTHRLVARLRPASSLADLRKPETEGLSKSWSNINIGDRAPRERTASVGDIPSPEKQNDEPVYVMAPPSPVLFWAYPQ